MYFQALDDKGECVGVYKDGELYFKEKPEGIRRTWKYAEFLADSSVEYASVYSNNRSLSDACPPYLIDDWTEVGTTESFLSLFCYRKGRFERKLLF